MPRKSKKIKFLTNSYKSEDVFLSKSTSENIINKPKSEDMQIKKSPTLKNHQAKKRKTVDMGTEDENSNFAAKPRKKKIKKRRFLSSNHKSTNEENMFSPSKSEIDNIPFLTKKNGETKLEEIYEISSEEGDFENYFNLDQFFNTREHSFSELTTDSHAGIDYEFVSDYIKNAKINSIRIYDYKEEPKIIDCLNNDIESSKGQEQSELEEKKDVLKNEPIGTCEFYTQICKPSTQSLELEEQDILKDEAIDIWEPDKLSNKQLELEKKDVLKNEPIGTFELYTQIFKPSTQSLELEEHDMLKDEPNDIWEPDQPSNKLLELGDKNIFNEEIDQYALITQKTGYNLMTEQSEKELDDSINKSTVQNSEIDLTTNNAEEVISPGEFYRGKVDCYFQDDCIVVILKGYVIVPFYGLFNLKVLHGTVEVLGYVLNNSSKVVNLFSPRGSSLLTIKNLSNADNKYKLNDILSLNDMSNNLNNPTIEKLDAVIKCTKLANTWIPFLEKYISQQIFPKSDENLPRVVFNPAEAKNIVKTNYLFDVINVVHQSTRLLITGGKGVGKSMFLRWAINRLLCRFEKIRVIDLDPGQPEFTVPGFLSVLTITQPVFGPNYTHLQNTERSYICNINIGENPSSYIRTINALIEYADSCQTLPTLINYMGFVQGIGVNIFSSALTYIKPTDIVEIISSKQKKNFKERLCVDIIKKNCTTFSYNKSYDFICNIHTLPAMTNKLKGWNLEPRQIREMCVLAYLGQMLQEHVICLTSGQLPMYEVKLTNICIANLQGKILHPSAINANLVALSILDAQSNLFVCYGYGVVRGIDITRNILVLITPESEDVLEKISHLVLGSVSLPPSIYMTADDILGSIPYVMEGELIALGQTTKRSYLPINK